MQLDVSRDFLDAISLQHPPPLTGEEQFAANGGLRFLPSSPDGKLHTVVVIFTLAVKAGEQPFAQGGWRFLFNSSEKFEPEKSQDHPFFKQLLMVGTGKVLTVINNLCLHGNMPILPVDIARMANQIKPPQGAGDGDGDGDGTEAPAGDGDAAAP